MRATSGLWGQDLDPRQCSRELSEQVPLRCRVEMLVELVNEQDATYLAFAIESASAHRPTEKVDHPGESHPVAVRPTL